MGPLGWQETVFIFVLALLIFGPKKLPELGKTIGKALTEFRRASSELKSTFDREMNSLERETESIRETTQSYTSDIYNPEAPYDESGAYGSESYDPASSTTPTVSASAPQGAESTASTTETVSDASSADLPVSQPGQNGSTHVAAAPPNGGVPDASDPKLATDTQAVSS